MPLLDRLVADKTAENTVLMSVVWKARVPSLDLYAFNRNVRVLSLRLYRYEQHRKIILQADPSSLSRRN